MTRATLLPTTGEILELFSDELEKAGGSLSDLCDDGELLFLRGILPAVRRVAPRDGFNRGVALRTRRDQICVHPYIYRQVCRNGAIIAQAIESREVSRVEFSASSDEIESAREAIRAAIQFSASDEPFARSIQQLRAARHHEADEALELLPTLLRLPARFRETVLEDIRRRYRGDSDDSLYGLTNAVTASARGQRDPKVRWRLEELGGGMPALVRPRPKPSGAAADLARV